MYPVPFSEGVPERDHGLPVEPQQLLDLQRLLRREADRGKARVRRRDSEQIFKVQPLLLFVRHEGEEF